MAKTPTPSKSEPHGTEPTEFETFEALTRGLLSVSKADLDAERAKEAAEKSEPSPA